MEQMLLEHKEVEREKVQRVDIKTDFDQENVDDAIISEFEKTKISHSVITIKYEKSVNTDLAEGKVDVREGISSSENTSEYWKSDNQTGCYGGGGFYSNLNEINELFEQIYNHKQDIVKKPYDLNARSYGLFTCIHSDNIKIVIGNEAREFLKKMGFDLDKFIERFNSLVSVEPIDEDHRAERTYKLLEQQRDRLHNKEMTFFNLNPHKLKIEDFENKDAILKLREECDKTKSQIETVKRALDRFDDYTAFKLRKSV